MVNSCVNRLTPYSVQVIMKSPQTLGTEERLYGHDTCRGDARNSCIALGLEMNTGDECVTRSGVRVLWALIAPHKGCYRGGISVTIMEVVQNELEHDRQD